MRIWKYPLAVTDYQRISMPSGAKILTVQNQSNGLMLWALADENAGTNTNRAIGIFGTGNPIPDDPGTYIATFQMCGGALIFHAFELR